MKYTFPAIIVHGGAGRVAHHQVEASQVGCQEAALAGWRLLLEGGSALDAVQMAVESLENNPLYNAGTGATLNAAGEIQMDASIMEGSTLAAGAVAAIHGIRNPVRLARKVLDRSQEVLLVGEGALSFARKAGIELCANAELTVEHQRQRWEKMHGTVGCAAVDQAGRSAAATSTGGLFDALPGRVGDSALIGCGTYANYFGAVSCTGIGEAIIRTALARTAMGDLQAGYHPMVAVQRTLAVLVRGTQSEAGLIVIDRKGRVGYAHNTLHMPVCWLSNDGQLGLDI
ncbi:isoaspartyl peptidase/L-asparaginase family protein [Nitrosococcus wardiae]|uniref:Isoaspartyl peptidase n=1 Tax=Nitrosococcus wardiae TaxID=1814290 RepID=A0A4P7C5N4_9GAMM|nr:isoaspartyl peptidase/L-asparaginase family protein [Nitrosococcus wardiae]QBQ56172.1 peptidase T [Nitrosococcus wardiae]